MRKPILASLALCSVLLVIGVGASTAAQGSAKVSITLAPAFTVAQLDAYAGDDWISNGGDLKSSRYSTLKEINKTNVSKLKLAWHVNLGFCQPAVNATACGSPEENAVVYKGVYYITDPQSGVYALDAATGATIWKYTPTWETGFNIGTGGRQPGVSIGENKVYLGQRDGKVVALDMGTGTKLWQTQLGSWQQGIRESETPQYYKGLVIQGTSGSDGGSYSNQMFGLNAANGAIVWAFSVVPTHSQPGGNTWPWSGVHSNYGGGAIWENTSIDSKTGVVVIGTGNPVPWNSRGPGENLWTNSVLGIDAVTGQFKWGYQTSRHDLWDSDLPNNAVLMDLKIGGKTYHASVSNSKLGWFHVIDTATGKALTPVKEVTVPTLPNSKDVNAWPKQPIPQTPNTLPGCVSGVPTSNNGANACYDQPLKNGGGRLTTNPLRWTGLTAPDGKPYKIGSHFDPYDTTQYVTAPFESMDWPEASYSPENNSLISCGVTNRTYGKEQRAAESQVVGPNGGIGSGILSVADSSIDPLNLNDFGNFSSYNLSSITSTSGGKFAWKQTWQAPCYSGSMNTAGGLTFIGHLGEGVAKDGRGYLAAVDTKTGAELWKSELLNAPVGAPPVTYTVNGKQYVSNVVGGESHNDPTRPNAAVPSQRVRGDDIYTWTLG